MVTTLSPCTKWLSLLVGIWLLAGCTQPRQPQRPSYRSGQVPRQDTTLLTLIAINERLADEADRQVSAYIREHAIDAYRLECGAWQVRKEMAHTDALLKEFPLTMTVFGLDGTLLAQEDHVVRPNTEHLPMAVDEVLWTMQRGETTTLICPWYAAYGTTGTTAVPAYTNCIIEIQINRL